MPLFAKDGLDFAEAFCDQAEVAGCAVWVGEKDGGDGGVDAAEQVFMPVTKGFIERIYGYALMESRRGVGEAEKAFLEIDEAQRERDELLEKVERLLVAIRSVVEWFHDQDGVLVFHQLECLERVLVSCSSD